MLSDRERQLQWAEGLQQRRWWTGDEKQKATSLMPSSDNGIRKLKEKTQAVQAQPVKDLVVAPQLTHSLLKFQGRDF